MNKLFPRIYIPLMGFLFIGFHHLINAELRYTHNDPFPLYTADNPIAQYTFWKDCELEAPARFSFSFFKQSANSARTNPFFVGSCTSSPASCTAGTTSNTCANCYFTCNQDVPLGNIYGPWNMLGLFYAEANGNNTIGELLVYELGLTNGADFGIQPVTEGTCPAQGTAEEIAETCIINFSKPYNSDPNQQFGFFDVPMAYRKYGFRFEGDLAIPCTDFGIRIQFGVSNIRQDATFVDRTCAALGTTCNVTPPICTDTSESATCPANPCCIINDLGSCSCKTLVMNGVMRQANVIFDTLGYDPRYFCKTQPENINFALYWAHCYELNIGSENSCWSHATLAPYLVGEVDIPLCEAQDTNFLFSMPFANNIHRGYGFTGGFTLNFIETIEIAFDAGFTKYSEAFYSAYPVPTNALQQGIYPRKADLTKRPGATWSFGATMAAYNFISCLSCFIQYRLLKHSQDHFCIVRPIPITPPPGNCPIPGNAPCPADNFVASNICLDTLKQRSEWSSSFVDVHFTYNVSEHVALGFVWQAPVKQIQAYRPTTIMGSLIIEY